MNKKLSSCIYKGNIFHKRFQPFVNQFSYRFYSLFINYSEIGALTKKHKFFSYNKFNIISFYDSDHGYRDGNSLKEYVLKELNKRKININNIEVKILCFPRVLGYVFNPISIIYCYKKKKLISIFYEVKNTSNEQHTYIFINKNIITRNIYTHKCKKKFYVSPFINIEGYYIFNVNDPKKKVSVKINQYLNNDSKILFANQIGKRIKFSSYNLMKLFITFPLLTIKVISMIHWQAFKILIKGGKYYKRKPKIRDTKSYEGKLI